MCNKDEHHNKDEELSFIIILLAILIFAIFLCCSVTYCYPTALLGSIWIFFLVFLSILLASILVYPFSSGSKHHIHLEDETWAS